MANEKKMTEIEMKRAAVQHIREILAPTLEEHNAEEWNPNKFAIPVDVNGQEIWVSVDLSSKAFKETKRYPAFDPFQKRAEWEAERAAKEREAEEKAKKKAEKIAKDKARREAEAAAEEENDE